MKDGAAETAAEKPKVEEATAPTAIDEAAAEVVVIVARFTARLVL